MAATHAGGGVMKWKQLISNHGFGAAIGLALIWIAVVIASGWGFNPTGIHWNFENTGQIGDSFGVVGAAMAAFAAYFAFKAYEGARADSVRLEQASAEAAFLNLLERRYDVLDRVRIGRWDNREARNVNLYGQDAIDHIVVRLFADFSRRTTKGEPDSAESYRFAIETSLGLGNLFRFTYHIVVFADNQLSAPPGRLSTFKNRRSYRYVRLLRAQMSDTELAILALNCAFGEGRDKFKPLVEKYALLHNLTTTTIDLFNLRSEFEDSAFGIE
jgi:hypothetical protein